VTAASVWDGVGSELSSGGLRWPLDADEVVVVVALDEVRCGACGVWR